MAHKFTSYVPRLNVVNRTELPFENCAEPEIIDTSKELKNEPPVLTYGHYGCYKSNKDAIIEVAGRSRGTPRIANRLLRRVRDYGQVQGSSRISLVDAKAALEMYEVDELGLDRLDRGVLTALIERFNGGPVGLSTLAIAVGEEVETVESVAEPFLVRNGFMARTPRGRVATAQGWRHIGRTPPAEIASLFDLPAPDA